MDIGTAVLVGMAALPPVVVAALPGITAEQDGALTVVLVTMVVVPLITLVWRLIGRFDKVVSAINGLERSNITLEQALDRATERSDATLAAAQRNGGKLDLLIQRMDTLERLHILRDSEAH